MLIDPEECPFLTVPESTTSRSSHATGVHRLPGSDHLREALTYTSEEPSVPCRGL